MSSLPDPLESDGLAPGETQPQEAFAAEPHLPVMEAAEPPIEPPRFFLASRPHPAFPNLLDVVLVGLMLLMGFFCSGMLFATALHYHLFGISTFKQASADIHYTLGSQVIWYVFTFLGCLLVFPLIWHTRFFPGIEWRGRAAFRIWRSLLKAAGACFVLAMIDGILMPGPKEAPIDQVFKLPGAAWLLFLFGITLAPFFEEMGFRGFLLPAFCNAFEWIANQVTGPAMRPDDLRGWKRWPIHAVVIAALVTAIPVASLWLAFKGHTLVCGLICCAWLAALGLAWSLAQRRAPVSFELPAPRFEPQIELQTGARWTLLTMALMSLYVSIPFAFMHGEQTGYSVGPFILLVCVSLVLCWARLSTRSLAASTMVHASYNLLLFLLMLWASGGFRNLDKM